ncbi:MAG: GAF domain-containing protein [Ruminococcaceae bacterium]|nr:GAF domain-containing protein [Oscillospiraceae bacterium]
MTDYKELCATLDSLTQGVPHTVANLANASALLYDKLEGINWAGFYLYNGEKLVLNAFQGKPACIEIPMGKGVCGKAAETLKTTVVPNVHEFPGHIACDSASNSEIVVPLIVGGELFGVLDIDSPHFDRFSDDDRVGLEEFANILCNRLEKYI